VSVVVLGDANVDLEIRLPGPDALATHSNPDPSMFGGGSAANTAAALGKLGVDCRFVGAVGADRYGRFSVDSLRQCGVDVSGVVEVPGEPTVLVVVAVPPDGDRLIYVWPPTGGAHRQLSPDMTLGEVEGAEWLHVTGLCLRVSPARESLLVAMEHAKGLGIPVSFDLNLRLENWGWDDNFRATVTAAIRHSDVVMGSASDELIPFTGKDTPQDAAQAVAGEAKLVIARMGADGALAHQSGTTTRSAGFVAEVVDTVGAGDAFNAGFIAARVAGKPLDESLAWGNGVAAIAITRHGARSTPTLAELQYRLEGLT
jgi:fructokinase/2-dehydro-3-deoxygluconokinase